MVRDPINFHWIKTSSYLGVYKRNLKHEFEVTHVSVTTCYSVKLMELDKIYRSALSSTNERLFIILCIRSSTAVIKLYVLSNVF